MNLFNTDYSVETGARTCGCGFEVCVEREREYVGGRSFSMCKVMKTSLKMATMSASSLREKGMWLPTGTITQQ